MMKNPMVQLAVVLTLAGMARADEKLFGIACRSVHLGYRAEPGSAFYNEVTVEASADGTYFCVIGFNAGYFGIQQLRDGKKLVIFSVWDPKSGDDPGSVPAEQRVRTVHQAEGVRVGRFGGEGTGGQSFFDFDWKTGETYRFLVTAAADADQPGRTAFAGYLFIPSEQKWKHLITFSTLAKQTTLSGCYSFVEDFRRNKESTRQVRKARFGNTWMRSKSGDWQSVTEAQFTADRNLATNIDAGRSPQGDRFWLATGGDTANTTTRLGETLQLAADAKLTPPRDWQP